MRIAYFDCFSGASGDMILGALMDAGLALESLKEELAKLSLTRYELRVEKVVKNGIGASQARVIVDDSHRHHHRRLRHIREMIDGSGLPDPVKEKSLRIFTRLAEAEARVHRTTVENIHFHEVGAVDAIVDVVGSVAGLFLLGVDRVYCSPLALGRGTVVCEHGTLPVPAPATAELVRGVPVHSGEGEGELLTPTGAAILTSLSSGFGPMPSMVPETTGYGSGTRESAIPNLLRIFIGQSPDLRQGYETESSTVIETAIDDMNPQVYDYLMEKMLKLGAMDVFLVPIHMKKNRPGTLLTVLCRPESAPGLFDFLLRETTTIGLRWRLDHRIKLHREIREIDTPYGRVSVKVSRLGNEAVTITPEYDDCRRLAAEKQVPLKRLMDEARRAASTVLAPE